jgi:CheY-like chemotaxis protein
MKTEDRRAHSRDDDDRGQDPKLSSDSFAAGAVVFLPKPFTTAQLQTMLQMLMGKDVSNRVC